MTKRVLAVLLGAAIVPGALADITGGAFRIDVSNEQGTGFLEFSSQNMTYHSQLDTWVWELAAPLEVRSASGALLATLDGANVVYVADPIIGLNFAVTSGASATTFTISSALLSFPTINPAEGQASAGMTVTDMDGNGATATGSLAGGKSYGAYYNGFQTVSFRNLVSSISVGPNGTATGSESYGFVPLGSVSDMSSVWDFTLSAHDSAAGTSRYEVRPVPEPASLVALALGAASLLRRRRK